MPVKIDLRALSVERGRIPAVDIRANEHPVMRRVKDFFLRRAWRKIAADAEFETTRDLSKLSYLQLMAVEEAVNSEKWLRKIHRFVVFWLRMKSVISQIKYVRDLRLREVQELRNRVQALESNLDVALRQPEMKS